MASTIHDLGKISIPAEILTKPTKLTNIEYEIVRTHAQAGFDILKDIDFPWPIARIVLEHHERIDGSGYPNHLTGDDILLESKILTVADVVEAMASHRPYRPSLGIGPALEEIVRNKGILYDTDIVNACLRLFEDKRFSFTLVARISYSYLVKENQTRYHSNERAPRYESRDTRYERRDYEVRNMIPLKVLMVEDLEDDALLLIRTLRKSGYDPAAERVQSSEEMTFALASQPWDIILCDFHLPGFSGIDAIEIVKKMNLDIPIIVVSGAIGEEMALECIHRGASDYIMKGNLTRLGLAAGRVLKERELRAKQRQDEEALRQSEEKFKTIANYTVDWESWFGPDGKYLWVNPAVERLTGYSADEVLAMPDFISVIIAEEDRDSFSRYFKEALTGTRGDNFEIRYLHKNGSTLWLSVSWQPVFDAQGNFLGIRTSGRDITAVKQAEAERLTLEKQLFDAQKMEALGALAGGIAHDFNNILGGIMGHAELATLQTDESIRSQNIQQILNSAERARNLVKQILAFSRPAETG